MQQDKAEMQSPGKLPEVRSFSFGSVKTNIHSVERLIIEKYLGIPFLHRGRTVEGLDCWGFLKLVYKDLGFYLFDIEDLSYERAWAARGEDHFRNNYENDWVKVHTPKVLDSILFLNSRSVAFHAGIMLKDWHFIHASRAGVVVSRLSHAIWRERIEGFYRLKKKLW